MIAEAQLSTAPTSPAQVLQATSAAVRVSFTWFGVRKTLTPTQKAQAAETFGAEGQYLSASKKLLDTALPAFRAVTSIRNRIVSYWRGMSLPYPEPGIRLIRQDRVETFHEKMTELRRELAEAVGELDRQLPLLRRAAQQRLGSLFDPADYPTSLADLFAVEWDFPSVEPPEYLMQLNPALYEQERQRIVARFEEAVRLAEQAFIEELSRLVSHLVDRLSGDEDGRPKTFRDSSVGNLRQFFEQFRSLSVRSNPQLDELVATAQRALRGVQPQELRDVAALRQQLASRLSQVKAGLDELLVDQPRRRIIRPHGREAAA